MLAKGLESLINGAATLLFYGCLLLLIGCVIFLVVKAYPFLKGERWYQSHDDALGKKIVTALVLIAVCIAGLSKTSDHLNKTDAEVEQPRFKAIDIDV
ncbi:hypothetical protein C9928_05610 [Pseudidiomarina aestuarii]|uniref:Uncharacterized protein n=1 Tax=Pseudidiomarina aestuarii TaxID=624146 RepID=A0A6N4DHE3_9GAMM|nr:hypothetical protein C9928_05610 [Pseudidiomarina aestuarii]